jgi:hypothetical protein
VRLIANANHPLGTITSILKNQGIRGLYRGLGPTILGYLPTWAIYFSVYDETKKWLGEDEYNDSSIQGEIPLRLCHFSTHEARDSSP